MSEPDDEDLVAELRRVARREGLDRPAPAGGGSRMGPGDPPTVGPYRLLRRIGAGGMGLVYEAEQSSPRRRVALKILNPRLAGESAVLRFSHEAEVLGLLDHPGIARIFEAGTVDGGEGAQPWFALELVEGRDLHAWLAEERPSRRRRLELFGALCDAVQHAHAKGVVHRDLKPANVLVTTEDHPKVLDFGIARTFAAEVAVTAAVTRAGQVVGTLAYLSPEQAGDDPTGVDTRTDVHALGILLFEMLTGALPYPVEDRTTPELLRQVVDAAPLRMGHVEPTLRGDLDIIAAKALAKEKERRYASAAALADDVRRFLAHEPIAARPPSAIYQMARFARRNRVLCVAWVSLVVVLVVGIVATSRQASRARVAEERAVTAAARERAERLQAQDEVRKAREVTAFLTRLLVQAHPEAGLDGDPSFREVLDRASRWIEAGELKEPEVEVDARFAVGTAYAGLGANELARRHLEAALALVESGRVGGRRLDLLDGLGRVAMERGDLDLAERYARQALALRDTMADLGPLVRAKSIANVGMVALARGRADAAAPLLRRALALVRSVPGDHEEEPVLLAKLAAAHRLRGEPDEAEVLLRDALELTEILHGEEAPDVAFRAADLASLLADRGRVAEAEPLVRRALAIRHARYGPVHAWTADCERQLALLQLARGELQSASALLEHALAVYRAGPGPESAVVAGALEKLALVRVHQRRFADAEPLYREALRIGIATVGEDHPDTLLSLGYLGKLLTDTGRPEQGEPHLVRCLALLRRTFADDHPRVATVRVHWGSCLAKLGRAAEAERELRVAHASLLRGLGPDDPSTRYAAAELDAVTGE